MMLVMRRRETHATTIADAELPAEGSVAGPGPHALMVAKATAPSVEIIDESVEAVNFWVARKDSPKNSQALSLENTVSNFTPVEHPTSPTRRYLLLDLQ
jgi:hypothetical protein